MFTVFAAVVPRERSVPGVVVPPRPVFPKRSTIMCEVVATFGVDDATIKSGAESLYEETESFARGLVVPMPVFAVKLFVPLQVLLEVVPKASESVSSVKTMGYVTAKLVSAEMSNPETSADPTVAHVAAPKAERTRTN